MSEKRNAPPGATGWRAGTKFAEQQSYTQKSGTSQSSPPAQQRNKIEVVEYKFLDRGKMRGAAAVWHPPGLVITCPIFRSENGVWARLPQQASTSSSGQKRYFTIAHWDDPTLERRWSAEIIRQIVEKYGQGAFDGGAR